MSAKCIALTGKGKPCRFTASHGAYCVAHAASNGDLDAMRELQERSKNGARKSVEAAESAKLKVPPSLRTTEAQLVVLERMLMKVENSAADVIAKSGAVTKLIAEARSVMKDAVLEVENAELRALIAGKHPHLAKQLRVVP